jgi:class 3 adenylate cyclase
MAMHKSEDLPDICEVMYKEFLSLGFNEMRNAIINIHNDADNSFVNYDYAEAPGKSTSRFSNNVLPFVQKVISASQRTNDAFSESFISGKELAEFKKVREQSGQKKDARLENATDLFFYFYSIGIGSIGISTYTAITDEQRELLKRFRNVFSLSYQRYVDISKAESQMREAQIEAGLERVRSRTLAMHSSDELAETAAVVFKQLIHLGIEPNRLYIGIIKEEPGGIEFWATDEEGSKVTTPFETNINRSDTIRKMYDGWEQKKKYLVIDQQGKELEDYLHYLSEELHATFKVGLTQKRRVQTIAYFSQGFIGIASPDPQPEETEKLLERFASVFNLTYARFNDLQIAEAHAIQAQIEEQKLREEKKRSDALLLNILPEEIANELKQFGKSYARKHDEVTVLFADIKGFSSIAENLSAEELVNQLDECFRAFDHIVEKNGLEKIKTIGDAYVCACGLPKPVPDNAVKTVRAAIDMLNFIKGFAITKTIQDLPAFDFRIGIHTGPVITGVVGLKKFTYDIWGDAVNLAARMEQHGEAGKINISESTYRLVKDKFICTPRGKIAAKNKGEVEMYFVESTT